MVRASFRVFILYLVLSLGVGMGIGQLIKASQVGSLNSEIAKQEAQISTLAFEVTAQVTQLKDEAAVLASELRGKQEAYGSLLAEQSSLSRELQAIEGTYANLDGKYQGLQESYEALLAESDNEVITELAGAKAEIAAYEQELSTLDAEKRDRKSQLLEAQISNAKLAASLDEATETNATLTQMIGRAESAIDSLDIKLAQLTKQIRPSPDHAMTPSQVWGKPEFRSTDWLGRDYELQNKVEEIGRLYNRTHTYILNETDCNDMAVDLWNMLLTENIKSVIVVGNLDKVGETFEELTHAWLYVFNSEGKVIYLEATTGEVTYGRLLDGSTNPRAIPYREGFIYKTPSTLWEDLKKMW